MAGSDSNTGGSTRRTSSDAENARVGDATFLAGLAGAYGEAAKLGPQVLALQKGLLAGMMQSRRREAERQARQGGDHSRAAAASQKADQLAELQAVVDARITDVSKFADALQRGGILHGYVVQPDRTPAEGHTVQLSLPQAASKKTQRGRAQTDASGYFRIDVGGSDQGGGILRFFDQLIRAVPEDADGVQAEELHPAAPQAEAHATAPPADSAPAGKAPAEAAPPAAAAPASAVQVLDPTGHVVFEDPLPPKFEGGNSEFRYYMLAEKTAAAPTSPRRTKKGTKKK